MIGIVVSEADEASVTIGEQLRDLADWSRMEATDDRTDRGFERPGMELRYVEGLHLEQEGIASAFDDPSLVVFVSRHAGDTGPLLTAHFPGNVGDAAYGGAPGEVPAAAPAALRSAYRTLGAEAPLDYDVGIECTHHGPSSVGAPCLFVEVGSGPDQWTDERAARAVAAAVLALDGDDGRSPTHTIVGLGGGHYAPRFERILAQTGWHVGHIAADWALDELQTDTTGDVLAKLFDRSGTTLAVSDGTSERIERMVSDRGYRLVSETWVRECDGVDLELVDAIEEAMGPIDDGTRIGGRVDVDSDAIAHHDYPDELLEALHAIDRETTVETWAAESTAYGTTENGNRLTGEVLVPADDDPRDLVEATRPLLESRYDDVSWDGRTLVVRERAFDPERARELGVPEGPAFGRLANGESVTIEDTVIEPKQVSSREKRRISALPL